MNTLHLIAAMVGCEKNKKPYGECILPYRDIEILFTPEPTHFTIIYAFQILNEKQGGCKTSQIIWDFPLTNAFMMVYDAQIDYGQRKWKHPPLNLWIHMENSVGSKTVGHFLD